MATPSPQRPPPPDPVGEPEVHAPPPVPQGREDLHPKRRDNFLKLFISHYLGLPMKECQAGLPLDNIISQNPFVGVEGGFLSYYASSPLETRFTSDGEPTLFEKFALWLKENVDPNDDNEFVKWVLRRSGIIYEREEVLVGSCGPVGRRILLSLGRIQPSAAQIQKQLSQILKSVRTIEDKSVESVEILREIKGLSAKAKNVVQSVEEAAGTEVEESVVADLSAKIKKINDSDISRVVKEVEILASNVEVPFKLREKYNNIKTQLLLLATSLDGLSKRLVKPAPTPDEPDPAPIEPAPAPIEPAPTPAEQSHPKRASGPVPFPKVGRSARDVLHKGFDLQPMLGEVGCKFSQTSKDPSVLFRISSTPSVKAIISQNELWGTDFQGALSLRLPFASNTSKAKVKFMHDLLSVNASVGLHTEPNIKIAAMAGSNIISGGGQLAFNTIHGSVTDFDVASSVADPELGTFCTIFNLVQQGQLDPKHGLYKALYSKTHGKNTYAAEMQYKFVEEKVKERMEAKHVIVATMGVQHEHDSGMVLKAKICSSGHVSGMIECPEGPGHSVVRASVQVDLRHLDRGPRVGFSISVGTTK